jgi:eukaryotic-like serine/threonine-protein kinase
MQPGDLLRKRYRIQKALSAGGFGETYLAVEENPDYPIPRKVVVKHLKPQDKDPELLEVARRLFKTEAKTLAALGETTDRIPTLYAYFEETSNWLFQKRSEFYLVQEWIDGHTLTAELAQGKRSEAQTIEIIHQILTGLSLVHHPERSNINPTIHRDLKPDNIIRRASDNKLVLIDFGNVKQIRRPNPNNPNTQISAISFGTPGYIPIEQGMGKPQLASDIYAVGAIAVQCLTGKYPTTLLNGDTLEFEWRHLCQVSDEFAEILTKMAQSRAIYRYQDAAEAKCAIESLLPSAASTSTPTPQPSIPYIPSPPPPSTPLPKTIFFPVWKTIQFISVKLDNRGKIIAKPKGKAEVFEENLGNGISMTMVKIPAGKFMMGSPESEANRLDWESPQHLVNVPTFYLGQTLVTQSQYQQIMGNNPAYFQGDGNLPVEQVSWLEAMDFCDKLTQKSGKTYRLPSEAEWEYACRAGTITPYAFGEKITPSVVNYDGNEPYGGAAKCEFRSKTTPVSSFPSNLFGLYDMHGNLYEWCLDEWVDNYNNPPTDGSARGDIISRYNNTRRLLRGGSWITNTQYCRSAVSDNFTASARLNGIGFRVVGLPFRSS